MNTLRLKNRPQLVAALQIALLLVVFQSVVATTPSQSAGPAVQEVSTSSPVHGSA